MLYRLFVVLLAVSVFTPSVLSAAEADPGRKPRGMKVYVTGNSGWVTTNHQEGYMYMGGGAESDDAMEWMANKTDAGDVVVIRTNSSDGYNDYIYYDIGGVDSVHTLVIDRSSYADSTYVETVIKNAEALFIAGGDQAEYYDLWDGTRLESAIHYLMDTKKAVIGGTSAGMAVLADIDYIPDSLGIYSSEALYNPYHVYMNFIKDDFIWGIPNTYGIITDTHFSERDRLGRTITFMARIIEDGDRTVSQTRAIACDEGAAVCIEANGATKIFGWSAYNDYVYFFKADSAPDRCLPGQSLNWVNGVTVYKVRGLPAGTNTFNLATWTGTGGTWHDVNVNYGVLDNDIQEPD